MNLNTQKLEITKGHKLSTKVINILTIKSNNLKRNRITYQLIFNNFTKTHKFTIKKYPKKFKESPN